MNLNINIDWLEAAIRFSTFTDGVSSCIVGSSSIENIKQNIVKLEKGKLPDELYFDITKSFKENDDNWIGQI